MVLEHHETVNLNSGLTVPKIAGFQGCLTYLPSTDPLVCDRAANCRSGKTSANFARVELSYGVPGTREPTARTFIEDCVQREREIAYESSFEFSSSM